MRFTKSDATGLELLYAFLRRRDAAWHLTQEGTGAWCAWWEGATELRGQGEPEHYAVLSDAVLHIVERCSPEEVKTGQVHSIKNAIQSILAETHSQRVSFIARSDNDESCLLRVPIDLGAHLHVDVTLGAETGSKLVKRLHDYLNEVAITCSRKALTFHRP